MIVKGKAEAMIKEADEVVEVVQKAAIMVEKISEDVADKLPNDT